MYTYVMYHALRGSVIVMQRRESAINLVGSTFLNNAVHENIDYSSIEQCEKMLGKAYVCLTSKKDNKWEQFHGLRELLSEVRALKAGSNFNGYSELENWLRYQLVCIFREILGTETNCLSVIGADGTPIIHLANFKTEFVKIVSSDDADGVRKDICDDFIYRCAFPTLQAEATREKTEISIALILERTFPNNTLKINVTIPLMQSTNTGMPYFIFPTSVDLMMDPEKHLNSSKSYEDEVNHAREMTNECVKQILIDRINRFGISDPLPHFPSFDAFYCSRHAAIPQGAHESVGVNPSSSAPTTPTKRTNPWKVVGIVLGAIIGSGVGAVIGFYVGFPLLAGAAAITVTAVAGFFVGAALGWAVNKLKECCYRPAKAPDSMAPAVIPPGKKVRHNRVLNEFRNLNDYKPEVSSQPPVEKPNVSPVIVPAFPPGFCFPPPSFL